MRHAKNTLWARMFELPDQPALPLQGRLRAAVVREIGAGRLAEGAPLPSSRDLAQLIGLSRNTVTAAYQPMGALDAFTRESVQEILIEVWAKTHKMVFFITHSVEEALFLATRLIVMSPSPGRISHVYDDLPFSREFLAHHDARRVKSEPAFIRLREEVLARIHYREPAHA